MPDALPTSQRRVLVIEDDTDLIALFREALGLRGFEVDGAPTIQEARDFITEYHYQVIICDVQIGHDRSLDFLQEVMPDLPHTQVIVLSGLGQYVTMAMEIGIEFFLAKPVSIVQLVNLVQRLSGEGTDQLKSPGTPAGDSSASQTGSQPAV